MGSAYAYVSNRPTVLTDPLGLWSFGDVGHILLDVGGLVPVFGEPLDAVNCAWYAAEGDKVNAGLSCAAIVPIFGAAAVAAKYGRRAARLADEAAKAGGAADHAIPIGPVSEKAWKVLDRVTEKGAPFPGYKGGRAFENRGPGMRLPESGPNGPISYREWDVNPYAKGVNRGGERLVTGSDGSAYYTTNHYDTFVRFR